MEKNMTKTLKTLAALAIALTFVAPAFAADGMMQNGDGMMKKEAMKHDEMAKDGMAHDGMAKDGMKHDEMAKDGMAKDGMNKDGMAH